MRLGTIRFSFLLCAVSVLLVFSAAHAQRKAPADPARPKIRAITAFIILDRAQYQQQIADAMTMLKRARTIFETRGYEVETIRISTQPFAEYTKGLTPEQALAFFKDYDALATLGDALDHCPCPGCTRSQQIHAGSAYLWLLTSRCLGEMQVSPGL
jgi:hypothetical protein